MFAKWLCFCHLFLFLSLHTFAHDAGASYLRLNLAKDQINGRWEIELHDLQSALKLDANQDGVVGLDELGEQHQALINYAVGRLKVKVNDLPGVIRIEHSEPILEIKPNSTNVILRFIVANLTTPRTVEVDYRLLFDLKPQHRGLLQFEARGQTQTTIFSPDHCTERFEIGAPNPTRESLSFGWQGIWHIWIGYDHILFLLALLLPAVLTREQGAWRPVAHFRDAFINVFKIVTAFTLAHSLTLGLAALEVVQLPSRWVESAIAASVVLAALNNLRPFFHGRAWLVAFGFGLIHGFGFASVLTELGLPGHSLLLALLGFNVGVEVGQLAIVAVFLPAAHKVRRSRFYSDYLLRYGSALIALVAAAWLIERTFNLTSR